MEFGPPEVYGRVTFCDDIRFEADGRVSLMGCFAGEIIFPGQFPLTVPKLGVNIQFFELPESEKKNLILEVFFPGDPALQPSFASEIDTANFIHNKSASDSSDQDTRRSISFNLVLSPVNIKQEGHIRAQVKKGENIYRIGRVRVSAQAFILAPTSN